MKDGSTSGSIVTSNVRLSFKLKYTKEIFAILMNTYRGHLECSPDPLILLGAKLCASKKDHLCLKTIREKRPSSYRLLSSASLVNTPTKRTLGSMFIIVLHMSFKLDADLIFIYIFTPASLHSYN
jgi:hypothetical protein